MDISKPMYSAVATQGDPRLDGEPDAIHEVVNQSRPRAIKIARQYGECGYWGSVYNQLTGECVWEAVPHAHRRAA